MKNRIGLDVLARRPAPTGAAVSIQSLYDNQGNALGTCIRHADRIRLYFSLPAATKLTNDVLMVNADVPQEFLHGVPGDVAIATATLPKREVEYVKAK
ncbi:MAG: hypothetical protein KBD15_01165 [Candidatus Magasanikbacteria bacterium]|nr:hypothetical protein [Candidatus Magasanikbacteria bacterium]